MANSIRTGARMLFNHTRMTESLVTRLQHRQDNASRVLQNQQSLRSLQKSQCRCSATQTTLTILTIRLSNVKSNGQRNLHQAAAYVPDPLSRAFIPEVREFSCEVAKHSDKEEIVNFVCKHFLKREPLMGALKISPTEARSFVDYNVKDALKDGASFVAKDTKTGKICGVRLNAVGHAEKMGEDVLLSPALRTLVEFLDHADGLVPEEYQNSRFMRHIAICVDPDIARSGVGTLMMQKSVEFSKRHQLQYMVAMCSGRIATGLASKMGFKTIDQVPYEDYVDPTQSLTIGDSEFPMKPFLSLIEEHKCANVMVKEV